MICVVIASSQERVVRMVHTHLERLRRMLNNSETRRKEVETKLADDELKLEESKAVIASLQLSKASLEDTLNQNIQETDFGKQARQACEEEITLLRHRSREILVSLENLEEEKVARKQHEYNSKHSLLRSFKWKEKDVDPVVRDLGIGYRLVPS